MTVNHSAVSSILTVTALIFSPLQEIGMFTLFLLKAGEWVIETEVVEGKRKALAKRFCDTYKSGTWKLRKV